MMDWMDSDGDHSCSVATKRAMLYLVAGSRAWSRDIPTSLLLHQSHGSEDGGHL